MNKGLRHFYQIFRRITIKIFKRSKWTASKWTGSHQNGRGQVYTLDKMWNMDGVRSTHLTKCKGLCKNTKCQGP